ncbi:MAG: hypothetical protein HOP25_01125 [Methylotenera sp.]|nr:hypothetical protein [Methylotenera sp.]
MSNKSISADQYFSRPADYLAFCIVGGNLVAFVDILRHPDKEGFANPDLIKSVASNWPAYMQQFKLNGILPGREHTQAEIHKLRSSGLNSSLNINNATYMSPGMGLTSASTPMKVTIAHDHVRVYAKELAVTVCDPCGPFRTPEISALSVPPNFSLTPTPSGLAVFESNTQHAFLLPIARPNQKASTWETLHDLVLPTWACEVLVSRAGLD